MPGWTSRTSRQPTACTACCCCRAIRTHPPKSCARSCSSATAWRSGSSSATASAAPGDAAPVGIAIGAAGLPSLIDLRGQPDLFGRTLEVSIIGFADEIAAAASLLQGQAAEAQPVVLVRGLDWSAPIAPAADLVRPLEEDLFR